MTRILLVDDEPLITDSLSYSLKREGFEVKAVGDGEQALLIANDEGLNVLRIRAPCRRVSDVADRDIPLEGFEGLRGEDAGYKPHALLECDVLAVAGHDAGAFLAPMLKRIEPAIDLVGRLRSAERTKQPTRLS